MTVDNKIIFEGANAMKIVAKLSIWNVFGVVGLIRDIARYF